MSDCSHTADPDESLSGLCPVHALDLASAPDAFRLGAEVGSFWTLADDPAYDTVEGVIDGRNAEWLMRIAEATGRPFSAEPVVDDLAYMRVTLGESSKVQA